MIGRRRLRRAIALVALTCAVLALPHAAWAHNALIGTTPEDGSTVARPPAAVVLTFNEPAIKTGTKVIVTGPAGEATSGEPRLVDNTVEQQLGSGLPAGEYTVQWRVTSADGHPINGTFTFRVESGAAPQQPTSTPTSTTPTSPTPTSVTSTPIPTPSDEAPSPWLWLLVIIPVGLAAVLGWRFSRR